MSKSHLSILIVAALAIGLCIYAIDRLTADSPVSTAVVSPSTAPSPTTLPAQAASSPSGFVWGTPGSYLLEFSVVLALSLMGAAGGNSTVLKFASMRQYTPRGEYVAYSQITYPETQYTPPPASDAEYVLRVVIFLCLYYVVLKLACVLMFGFDTARVFGWLWSLLD